MRHLKRLGYGFAYLGIFALGTGVVVGGTALLFAYPKTWYVLAPLVVLAVAYSFGYSEVR